ncbi:hypothetical protein OsJ_02526 [Oryza sativa Japonica Group]|uniref:Uncharacterized protein n=1 Tax=Oryza sativa subsp. japonica TaxID=39947 RepID=B9EXZ0_ORYSJ|nr:hypothetical protein OsJ_02526 [Oryza sativa Japonica Group]
MEVKKALRLEKGTQRKSDGEVTSYRKISDLQAFEIETANDSGIGPKTAYELASRQVGGSHNLSYNIRDHKNYLRSKRQREMAYGQEEKGSEVRVRSSKRTRNWLDKKRRTRTRQQGKGKKGKSSKEQNNGGDADHVGAMAQMVEDSVSRDQEKLGEYSFF